MYDNTTTNRVHVTKTFFANTLLSSKLYTKGWILIESEEGEEMELEEVNRVVDKTTVTVTYNEKIPTIEETRNEHKQFEITDTHHNETKVDDTCPFSELTNEQYETKHEEKKRRLEYCNNTVDMDTNPFIEAMTDTLFETLTPSPKFITNIEIDDDFWDISNFMETEELQKYINSNNINMFDEVYIG
jgi:hypothetical protein